MVQNNAAKDAVIEVAECVSTWDGVRSVFVGDEGNDELEVVIAANDYILLHAAWNCAAGQINGSRLAFAYGASEEPGCRMRMYVKGEGGPVGCD